MLLVSCFGFGNVFTVGPFLICAVGAPGFHMFVLFAWWHSRGSSRGLGSGCQEVKQKKRMRLLGGCEEVAVNNRRNFKKSRE